MEKMANVFASALRHCICLRHLEREVLEEEEKVRKRSCLGMGGLGGSQQLTVMWIPATLQLQTAYSRSALQRPAKAQNPPRTKDEALVPVTHGHLPTQDVGRLTILRLLLLLFTVL